MFVAVFRSISSVFTAAVVHNLKLIELNIIVLISSHKYFRYHPIRAVPRKVVPKMAVARMAISHKGRFP